MPASKSLIGEKFTRLSVLEKTDTRSASGSVIWKCRCDCNAIVYVSTGGLKSGDFKSCGCLKTERIVQIAKKNTKHGASQTKIQGNARLDYKIWCGIKQRCYNKKDRLYRYYGARGIIMHRPWIGNFPEFSTYIRNLPKCPTDMLETREGGKRLELTLDRIKNEKGYQPGNLRWATKKEQANNRRPKSI